MSVEDQTGHTGSSPHTRGGVTTHLPLWLFVVVVGIGIAANSTYALLTLLLDGLAAATVILPAALGGLWLVPLLRLKDLPLRWHLLLGSALGIGSLSALVLILGAIGLLSRGLWTVLLVVVFAAGVVRLRHLLAQGAPVRKPDSGGDAFRWVWLVLAPFVVLAVLAAVHAPGYLWSEEGGGYDSLEYHLALPKEFRADGSISYTPHNVYGNFPFNVEMLYLLTMIVLDSDIEAGTAAHMVHLLLGALAVFAAYVAGREWSPRAGTVAAMVMGSCGWFVYLAGLAYVENGLLFFSTAALAAGIRGLGPGGRRDESDSAPRPEPASVRMFVAAGVLAGFAYGCKYTAAPMFVLPIAITGLFISAPLPRRLYCVGTIAVASAAAMSPWLVKNYVATKNPVFPLANRMFQATPPGWGMTESDNWDRSHSAAVELAADPGRGSRLRMFWNHVLTDKYGRFGPLMFILACSGCLVARIGRRESALLLILAVQLVVWLTATHLYARFAVVLVVPLAVLAGRCALFATSTARTSALIGLLVVGAGVNFLAMLGLYRAEGAPGAIAPASYIYDGKLPGYEHLATVNGELPEDASIMVIGDAKAFYYDRPIDYHVVFNRNPFAVAAAANPSPSELAAWIRDRGYSHVLVHFAEINRLRHSAYGFPSSITRELFATLERDGHLTRTATVGGSTGVPRVIIYAVTR